MTTTREHRARAINALAVVMHELRPDWDPPGCVAALRAVPPTIPVVGLAYTALRYASDPANTTPAMIADLSNRAWESFDPWPCKTHPQTRARRVNGECAACWTDRREDPDAGIIRDRGGQPMPDKARELLDGLLRATAPKTATPDDATGGAS